MIYPEPGLVDQYSIPWWIFLVAILAGILLLTLLVCILWKVRQQIFQFQCLIQDYLKVQLCNIELGFLETVGQKLILPTITFIYNYNHISVVECQRSKS